MVQKKFALFGLNFVPIVPTLSTFSSKTPFREYICRLDHQEEYPIRQVWPAQLYCPKTFPALLKLKASSSSASGTRSALHTPRNFLEIGSLIICDFQSRGKGYFAPGLYPSPPRRLPPPHRWTLCKEAIQKGTNAHC